MTTGENIKAFREKMGLTQAQLADIAGVTDKAVSSWENGSREPRTGPIEKIAAHYGLKKTEIVDGKPATTNDDGPLSDPVNREMMDLFLKLTPEEQRMQVDQLKWILSRR
jgi:transcriptional regulator with XRE-family HTH domain